MSESFIDNIPRLVYVAFSVYALLVVFTRWQASRVMTQDKRFLMLFFIMECMTVVISALIKMHTGVAPDPSVYLTILTQSFLAAYLHYSIPTQYRRWHHRFTRRSHD